MFNSKLSMYNYSLPSYWISNNWDINYKKYFNNIEIINSKSDENNYKKLILKKVLHFT